MNSWFKLHSSVQILIIVNNQILMMKRMNTGFGDGKYGLPAGKLNGNEEIRDAAVREAKEECGIEIARSNIDVVGVMHRKSNSEWIDFFLIAHSWDGEITNAEPDKCEHLKWCDLDNLPDNTISHIKKAIENYRSGNGMWFDTFGW